MGEAEYKIALCTSLWELAEIPCAPDDIVRLSGGQNNAVYRIQVKGGPWVFAKRYLPDRNRLEREYGMLQALSGSGFTGIPHPLHRLDHLETGLYTFVCGRHLSADQFAERELMAIVDHFVGLDRFEDVEAIQRHPPAIMSAFTLRDVLRVLHQRMDALQGFEPEKIHDRVRGFLEDADILGVVMRAENTWVQEIGLERLHRRIPAKYERFSQADSGPHNMLWTPDRQLVVVDWEYGGRAHPMWSFASMLQHEQMRGLSAEGRDFLVKAYLSKTPLPFEITQMLPLFLLLTQIEWVMCMVSSMLPDKIECRINAAPDPKAFDIDAYIVGQINKTVARLASLASTLRR